MSDSNGGQGEARGQASVSTADVSSAAVRYSLWQLSAYFLRLGTLGFGGPVALVGYMHRDLVERRNWIHESDYKEGLALAQLMPGPLAAQLSMYLGYVHYRTVGATFVGIAFVLPSFLMVVGLGWAYRLYGGLAWMQAVFYGVGASVIGIIAISGYKLTQKTIGKDVLLWAIFAISMAVTVVTESEMVFLFLAAGVLVWFVRMPPRFLHRDRIGTLASLLFPLTVFGPGTQADTNQTLLQILLFFTKAGAFVLAAAWPSCPFCTAASSMNTAGSTSNSS